MAKILKEAFVPWSPKLLAVFQEAGIQFMDHVDSLPQGKSELNNAMKNIKPKLEKGEEVVGYCDRRNNKLGFVIQITK